MAQNEATTTTSTIARGTGFFRESVEELKKVQTPTRQETVQATIVTVVVLAFVSMCLFILDAIFQAVMGVLLG